jgi:hypothetical protein
VQVAGIAIDFKGKFYKTAIKFPFASIKLPCASSAAAPAAGAAPCATTPPATTGATK